MSQAANFVMSGSDAVGASSFNSGANWPGGAAPAAGNTYQTGANLLRTPANSTSLTFAGSSLEIQTGGNLRDKTTAATITVNNLILDNGSIFDMSGDGSALAGKYHIEWRHGVYQRRRRTNVHLQFRYRWLGRILHF